MINQVSEASSSDTRTRLVETARRLFHEQGYHATGVATILRESGVNSGSLYHFFDGKEALLVAVLERYLEMLDAVVLAPREESQDDPLERVFDLLAWYRAGLERTRCKLGCPIGNLALELADDHPRVRELIDANFRGWTAGVRRWLDESAPRLPPDTDTHALSEMVLTVMEGGVMQSRARGSLAPFDAGVAVLRSHTDRLLAAGRGRTNDGDLA